MIDPRIKSPGFAEDLTDCLREGGLTPEQARDYVVSKFVGVNLNEDDLKRFTRPLDEIARADAVLIVELALWRKEEPAQFVERARIEDLSDHADFVSFCVAMDS